MKSTLSEIMERLYASEINSSVSCLWDGGWDVKLGDSMNGFLAEETVRSHAEATQWLHEQAHRHFPNSVYAKQHPLSGCCEPDCSAAAEFRIEWDPQIPDNFTDACEAHVGALLGHRPEEPAPDHYRVYPL